MPDFEKALTALQDKLLALTPSVARLSTRCIPFDATLRTLCEQNVCGAFGTNYTCPPYVGEIHTLIDKVKSYDIALIFRAVYPLEDSYDYEGMVEGGQKFRTLAVTANRLAKEAFPDAMTLAAGGCRLCQVCGLKEGVPCRNPEDALASLEAHGIHVSNLAVQVGMPYISGPNTVTYFGSVFVRRESR